MNVAFVCVWVGEKYGPEYVAILRDMVLRNATRLDHDQAFFCLTDRPDELPDGVYPIPAPDWLPGWWAKIALFSPDMPWEPGTRVVYFDLDVAITGRLEDLPERKGIIRDWNWPCLNSSVMVWNHGEHRIAWDTLNTQPDLIDAPPLPRLAALLPAGAVNGGDQELLTSLCDQGLDSWDLFPAEWFVSYRDAHGWPPTGSKAVIMHGDPKPHEIADGWVPNVWKLGGFTSFPEVKGANTSEDYRLDNVRSAVAREHIPWFTGFRDEGKSCLIIGGAPSMRNCIPDIRWHARQAKTRLISVNNAWRTLVENGITPDVHVMLDARPENAEFVRGAPKRMRFVIASQCHPDVFDVLEAQGNEVAIWHSAHNDNTRLLQILEPWWNDGPRQKPTMLVPGGSTVGLRCLWLATYSGFRKIHMYGVDSSYAADGSHHAYAQTLNDGETVIEVVRGDKRYRCAGWMVRQASEFEETWNDLRNYVDFDGKPAPVRVQVHGTGLIPDIARSLRLAE
jgi:uncharacterized Rossmann fold enzyme